MFTGSFPLILTQQLVILGVLLLLKPNGRQFFVLLTLWQCMKMYDNVMTQFIINNLGQTPEKLKSICFKIRLLCHLQEPAL